MKKIILFYIFISVELLAQDFGMGVLLDDTLYKSRPLSVKLMRGDYAGLPSSYSLKEYAPTPGNQGDYGTCAVWSSVYGGKTILEAIKNRWTKEEINANAFSPSFVYNQIRTKKDCYGGVSLLNVLNFLKTSGTLKFSEFGYDCEREVQSTEKDEAVENTILEYRTIADYTLQKKTAYIKKSLYENKPVIVAIDCPNSFKNAKDVWIPDSSDYRIWSQGHGMTIVGYDDHKYGGAFELLNSWGTKWGYGGFTWIAYSDLDFFCKYAFELIDADTKNKPLLSGSFLFREDNGEEMKVKQIGNIFETEKSFATGTLFELRISNDEPAYVYAFATDITLSVTKIFPFNETMSAYLPYKKNDIAIPNEDSYNMLDATKGSTYYVFLYSKEKLEFDTLISAFEKANGDFTKRFTKVFGSLVLKPEKVFYDYSGKVKFRAEYDKKKVVPLIVKIKHDG